MSLQHRDRPARLISYPSLRLEMCPGSQPEYAWDAGCADVSDSGSFDPGRFGLNSENERRPADYVKKTGSEV